MLRASSIACSLPEVFAGVRRGERILIDDGRIDGVIRDVNAARFGLRLLRLVIAEKSCWLT
jgi:pyruvate kinase